jgi:fimbrial chaperone protein
LNRIHPAHRAIVRDLRRTIGLAALPALFAAHAFAQVLIEPVVVELGARQRAASVTITLNPKATASLTLQSQVLQWEQALDGTSRTQPSTDLVVAPPIMELKPGESQLLRIGLRGPRRGPGEQAYRLVLEDVAAGSPAAGLPGVSFRMRYDLPVLLAPAEPVRKALRWLACAPSRADEACVRVANDGNRRVSLRKLSFAGSNWTVPVDSPGTVLASTEREWRLPLPAGGSGPALRVSGQNSRGEAVQAELQPP